MAVPDRAHTVGWRRATGIPLALGQSRTASGFRKEVCMVPLLLWLLGVPLSVIIILWLLGVFH